jgi:uncharacterized membrane protein
LNTEVEIAPNVLWTQRLAVGCLVGLVVLSLGWELWWAPIRPGGSWLALKALPLCIPLAGLLKRRLYTYRWVSLLVWLYFTEGVVRAWSDPMPSRMLAGLEIALCLGLFAACAAHVRFRFQHARQLALAQDGDPADPTSPAPQGAPHV